MTRLTHFLAALVAATAVLVAAAPAGADSGSDYVKYAKVRDRVHACVLDRQWGQLSSERRKQCGSLRKLYRIWTGPGYSDNYHLSCLTTKCPAAPPGAPDPRAAMPDGSKVYKP
jgi:hypothetical protein